MRPGVGSAVGGGRTGLRLTRSVSRSRRCSREFEGYGLLAVCSASNVNVAAEVMPCSAFPVVRGRLTRKHSTSLAPAARFRSPAWAPWAELPSAAPLRVVAARTEVPVNAAYQPPPSWVFP